MASRARSIAQAEEWARHGATAARNGETLLARGYFARAVDADRRNPAHRFNLALVLEREGALAESASLLAEALAMAPASLDCADRLSSLLARYTLEDNRLLDPVGLKAALAFDRIDRQAVGEAALARLKQDQAFADETAFALLPRRTAETLRDDLLLTAIATAINKDPAIEAWLVGLRRALLVDTSPERFEDRALQMLALALVRQCLVNEHVWPESETESTALAGLGIDPAALLDGDPEMGRRLLLQMLYRPLETILPADATATTLTRLRPKSLRELVVEERQQREAERTFAAQLPRIGTIADATSRRVQAQYESAPYPRWRSLRLPRPGAILRALGRYAGPQRLQPLTQPFDVLIAGCGTGRQALQSAAGYGPNARVTAIDLSAASLAYAARQAAHFAVGNVAFAQADLLGLEPARHQYAIVECVGVLHHMADPWAGLSHLSRLMKPGGFGYIGLYSQIARQQIAGLRQDLAYPGPGCSDAAARLFRQHLLEGPEAGRLAQSKDFYALSEFRDLALHESEQALQLTDIASHLEQLGLEFLGFTLDSEAEAKFAAAYPDDRFPGQIAHWIALEAANPRIFDAMYRFWVRKAD